MHHLGIDETGGDLIAEGLDDDEIQEPKEVLLYAFNSCVAPCPILPF
jgi:hypothetical protein